jgi:hypothetical protein
LFVVVTFVDWLNDRLVQAYAEEHAIQDLLFYLADGLRRQSIGLDIYLKVSCRSCRAFAHCFSFSTSEIFRNGSFFSGRRCKNVDKSLDCPTNDNAHVSCVNKPLLGLTRFVMLI